MSVKNRLRSPAFQLKKLSAAVVSAILFSNAEAAGLGDLTVLSALGQPLRAEIELVSTAKDSDGPLTAKLASYEAYRQANVEFSSALMSLRFAIEPRGDKQFIRVTSTQPMNEPFIDLLLELNSSNGRLVREYIFLLDPVDLHPTPITVTATSATGNATIPIANTGQEPRSSPAIAQTAPANPVQAASKPARQAAKSDVAAKPDVQPAARNKASTSLSTGPKSRLTLTGVDPVSSPESKAAMEDYASMEKTVAEANARVKVLEQKVNELQKLLEVTNSLLAEMQKQNALTKAGMQPAAPVAAAAATPVAGADVTPTEIKSAMPAAPAVAAAPAAPAPVAAIKPKPAAAPPETSVTDEPLLLPGAGLLLAALGALGFYFLRRKKAQKPFDAPLFSVSSPDAKSAAGGKSVDLGNSVFNSSYLLQGDRVNTNEVDAISEADIYIAYGRDIQAEEVLQEALRAQPERHAVRVKLLSIYAARKDPRSFETLARELMRMTNSQGEDWAQAVAMGVEIDPTNPLYASRATLAVPTPETGSLTASAELAEEFIPAPEENNKFAPATFDAGTILPADEATEPVALPALQAMPEEDTSLAAAAPISNELEFDLEGMRVDDVAVPLLPSAVQVLTPAEPGPIDFDFVLPEIPAIAEAEAAAEIPPAELDQALAELGALDFDFVEPKTSAPEKT